MLAAPYSCGVPAVDDHTSIPTPMPAPLVIAHRGASGYRPEHSRSAVELAIELGADAIEPDLVPTRDGVLVVRHDNELSTTTDVAAHPEFRDRRTSMIVDGHRLTGWFTEHFTWDELSTLTVCERIPKLRPTNSAFDGQEPILRLQDLLDIIRGAPILLVAELKHAAHFASVGLPLDRLFLDQLGDFAPDRVNVESFELTILESLRSQAFGGALTYLLEARGAPADRPAVPFARSLTDVGLAELAQRVTGISVDKSMIIATDMRGRMRPNTLVERAHAAGLTVFTWTLRAENRFLLPAHRLAGGAAAYGDWRLEFERIFAAGVDGVFADQPDLAIASRSSMARPSVGGRA